MIGELAWAVEDFRARMKLTLLAVVLMCVTTKHGGGLADKMKCSGQPRRADDN